MELWKSWHLDKQKRATMVQKEKELWKFWHYEWAEHEFPGEMIIYYKGPLIEGSDIQKHLKPGVAAGYITVEGNPPGDVTIRFKPENIFERMRHFLPRDICMDHYAAMEEAGWILSLVNYLV